MLIYAVSLRLQLPSCVNILNLCTDTELMSPIYFGNGATCPKLSDQQIDIDTEMNISFEICATQNEFEGALLFELERYSDWNDWSSVNTLTTKNNKNGAAYVHMLVAWKVKDFKHLTRVVLVEHTKEFTWNEDRLKEFYDKNCDLLKEYDNTVSDAWLMDDNTILKTSSKVEVSEGNFELNISISEEERDNYAMRPL
jgi:hypothetical protein